MELLVEKDYFTDHSILRDPYAFFDAIRRHGPIYTPPGRDYMIVTGFEETNAILRNSEDFSSVVSVQGAGAPLPFAPAGSDITDQIEKDRLSFHGGNSLVAYDDQQHSYSRSVLMRLFTPSRLKANELFMADYADQLAREAVTKGGCELLADIAIPFVTLVIADLLGVPAEDRQQFMDWIRAAPPPGSLNASDALAEHQPMQRMEVYFRGYVEARRATPSNDIISELANARYPDGSIPDAAEIVRLTTFLFGAGQDTSAKLIGNCLRFLTEEPGLQDLVRAEPKLIPKLIEEVLRLEGSSKITSRVARRDTQVAGVDMPAGTKILLALSAANRDDRRWPEPNAFEMDRPKLNEHLSFGRGAHTCAGAPLARVEVRVLLEALLRHTSAITLDEAVHGPPGARTLDYEASFIVRGLTALHLHFSPCA